MAVGLEFSLRHEIEKVHLLLLLETRRILVEVFADGDVRQGLFHP